MRIAVVIPMYNEQAYIRECLDCIARQTRRPDQVIIVDNNCSDTSVAIVRTYSFVTIITEPIQGICAASRSGFEYAALSADIIARCDADSRPADDWLEKMVNTFASSPHVSAITGPGTFYDMTRTKRWLADVFYMRMYFWSVGIALGQPPLFGSNCAIRTNTWRVVRDQVHLSRQDIHDDIDMSYHIAKIGAIKYDAKLVMPISGRPFRSITSLARRYPMAMRSIRLHWPEQTPWRRYSSQFKR